MASKRNIRLHLDAISACDSKDYQKALPLFQAISDPTAPIIYNIGTCYLLMHEIDHAIQVFQECLSRDKYMAIGHFQYGIAQSLRGDYHSAIQSFKDAAIPLRGNPYLDYKQLNLPCKLHACEISYNLGLLLLVTGDYEGSRNQMLLAAKGSLSDAARRSFIADGVRAVCTNDMDYFGANPCSRLLMPPENAFYRVSKNKAEGLVASTDFMPKAKVIAASNPENTYTGFMGARSQQSDTGAPVRKNIGGHVVGPPPSVPPPRLPPSPRHSPKLNKAPPGGVFPELQGKFESRLTVEDRAQYPQYKEQQDDVSVTVTYEFKMKLPRNIRFDNAQQKLKNNLQESVTGLPVKMQQLSLELGSQFHVKSDSEWQSAWSSMCSSNSSDITIRMRENENNAEPRLTSSKLKPSRPAPRLH